MRLTMRTNLAMRSLMYCAANPGQQNRSIDIATACNASLNHLMQVVPVLHKHGYVVATRGRSGGVMLAQPTEDIRVGPVIRLFEANLPFTECFDDSGHNSCPLSAHCLLKSALAKALEAFYAELDKVTLADLMRDNCALEAVLKPAFACAATAVPA